MKSYFGNHIGICINNNDPERRGRVQIFIPHIMPALYDGWNEAGIDIDITCVGPNLVNGLSEEQITKLRKILPWAESASPVCGGSSPGNLISRIANGISHFFDQSPKSSPSFGATPTSSSASQPTSEWTSTGHEQSGHMHQSPQGGQIPVTEDNPASGGPNTTIINETSQKSPTDPALQQTVQTSLGLDSSTQAANATIAYNTAYKESLARGATNQQASFVAAAIAGNAVQESGFNPSKSHDNGIGYGLLGENQDQLQRMESYAATKGESITSGGISTQTQIEALFREPTFIGSNQRSGGFDTLINSNNVAEASDTFAKGYLLPTAATANYENRQQKSLAALGTFSNFTPEQLAQQSAAVTAAAAAGVSATNLVNRPNPHGALVTQNLNNTAKGMFTYPAAGAMLWVFFREGNPLYPVYFAASYSNEEWKSAYKGQSPSEGQNSGGEGGTTSIGTFINYHGVGGMMAKSNVDATDPSKNEQSMMFFGESGNMHFGTGYHQIFSKYDRRDQVEGDRWNTTLGYKEDWVQGDHNHVTMGDSIIKIGNVSKEAVDAVNAIIAKIKECQKPLSELKK
jgi:hypothetical protein